MVCFLTMPRFYGHWVPGCLSQKCLKPSAFMLLYAVDPPQQVSHHPSPITKFGASPAAFVAKCGSLHRRSRMRVRTRTRRGLPEPSPPGRFQDGCPQCLLPLPQHGLRWRRCSGSRRAAMPCNPRRGGAVVAGPPGALGCLLRPGGGVWPGFDGHLGD